MDIKQFLKDIKAKFNGETMPPAPAPAPAPTPATPTMKTYKLQDGTDIMIHQSGDMPAAGDMVMIGGAPAAANTYTLSDGATIVVDATGMITTYTAMAAPPSAPAPAPMPAQPVTLSAEEVAAMYAKFAIGSPEDRLANLEVMMKALMECNFGYQIRQGQEADAIQAYKESLAPMQTSMEAATAKLQSAFEKAESQQAIITRHEETIKGLFELVEKLVEMPTADPVTLTGTKKEKFENQNKKEDRIAKMAESVKAMKEEANK